jgi:site-specific DNA recombinase
MRTASYARYSSENQRETSIEDQLRLTDERAAREGWSISLRYTDMEISASTPTLFRAGGRALIETVRARRIDVLLIESLDRCWRDIVDQEITIRDIERLGVRIIGISDGYDSLREGRELQRVIIGGVNQQYLRDLGKKVHRGLTGQTERGYHAGGLGYGYRTTVAGLDAKGEPIGHRLEIDEERAQWVRWIFERHTEGWAPRRIVYELNRLGVPSPRGNSWSISALYGQQKYGTGILRNELYRGRYIWNRSQWTKDYKTGKRQRNERPVHEWRIKELPALRIIHEDLWAAVQVRLTGHKRPTAGKPKRTLLSGILRCGNCNAAVPAINKYLYGCSAAKDRGPTICEGVMILRTTLEARILDIVRSELFDEEAVAELRREVATLQASARREQATGERTAKARLATIDHEITLLVDAIANAGWSEALRDRLRKAEAERQTLHADLTATHDPVPPTVIPRLIEHYRAMVNNLPILAQRDPQAAREALQELLGEVRLSKDQDGAVWAHVPEMGGMFLKMVAGERFLNKKHPNISVIKRYRIA